jgi:MinD-like ATPase involved in chromosome partitioning or flagellar assembly
MTGRVITFYSYKGGVGRSFLLANVGVWMARVGFKVLCVDWDLEAPGLFHYFNENSLLRPGRRAGLVDLIPELTKGKRPDWKRLLRGTNLKDAKGSLDLLDAGDASSDEYGKQLAAIDWDGRYKSETIQLGERIEELRREWIRDYDFVLLDSRTGLTDIGGICTAQLPDLVVLVLAPNTQGIGGTLGALAKARKQRSLLPLDRGDFMVLPVPSRFDPNAVGAELDKWTRVLAERLQPLYDEWRDKDTPVERLHALLRIPHVARWSLGEPLPVLLESADDPSSVSHAIETVAAFLACDLHDSKQLVEERNRYVREVMVRNRSLLGVETVAPAHFKYELFLSFSRADRDYARAVAAELAARGRSVFFDEQAIESGTLWANALARALGEARNMAAVVGKEVSSWQRSEVEAFADLTRADNSRAVIPVLRHGNQPNWPELFAFQGAKIGAGSPAETASALHAALRQLETPKQTTHPKTALVLWTEPEALSAYRQWVADQHEKLIPYFDGAADLLLEETFVQVELEPTHSQEDPAQIEGLNRSESGSRLGPHALHEREGKLDTVILEELLVPQARGPVAPRWPIVASPALASRQWHAASRAQGKAKQARGPSRTFSYHKSVAQSPRAG